MPVKLVRAFVGGNKNDVHDARAIWTAVQQPGVKTVAVKSEEQQAALALHRMRQQLVKFRTAQINGLRGRVAPRNLPLEIFLFRKGNRCRRPRRTGTAPLSPPSDGAAWPAAVVAIQDGRVANVT